MKVILDMSKKDLREQIYQVIENDWPVHISGIARKLNMPVDEEPKRVTSKIGYHIKLLKDDEKVLTKKIDRALVIWPHDIEKLRFVHEMLR